MKDLLLLNRIHIHIWIKLLNKLKELFGRRGLWLFSKDNDGTFEEAVFGE
jgi:hypothetical protein